MTVEMSLAAGTVTLDYHQTGQQVWLCSRYIPDGSRRRRPRMTSRQQRLQEDLQEVQVSWTAGELFVVVIVVVDWLVVKVKVGVNLYSASS